MEELIPVALEEERVDEREFKPLGWEEALSEIMNSINGEYLWTDKTRPNPGTLILKPEQVDFNNRFHFTGNAPPEKWKSWPMCGEGKNDDTTTEGSIPMGRERRMGCEVHKTKVLESP
jgi:hypothetical protein